MKWIKVNDSLPSENWMYDVSLKLENYPAIFTTQCYWQDGR